MSYYYVGSPYSRFPGGLDAAFREICLIMGGFVKARKPAYSPIAHTHPIAMASGIDPFDHAIWLPFDKPMMEGAKGLAVVTMTGWQESKGLREEIAYFRRAGKPIHYIDPDAPCLSDLAPSPLPGGGRRSLAAMETAA